MATQIPQLGKTGKYGDLKKRLLFLLGALVVFRIGAHIPVPGIDPIRLAELFQSQQGGILGLFNMFSGGALSRFTIFALGIMPYISSSIIMQLMTAVSPQLEQLKKEGQAGQRKITQYTRYGTVLLELVRTGAMHPLTALLITAAVVVVTWGVCFVERGQRKILVNYAKRQIGNKIYGGQASHLPFKLNMSG